MHFSEFSCEFTSSVGAFSQKNEGEKTDEDQTSCLSSCLADVNCKAVTYSSGDSEPCSKHAYVGRLEKNENVEYFRKACPDSVSESSEYFVSYFNLQERERKMNLDYLNLLIAQSEYIHV